MALMMSTSFIDPYRAIAIFVIERLGRRNLLLWTAVLMGVTMAILAGLYDLVYAGNKVAQVFSVLMLFLFNSWFSVGWLGLTWLYPAEITPLRIRAVSTDTLRQALLMISPPMDCLQRRIGCSTSLSYVAMCRHLSTC